mgnify:CR=1 FL=1
MDTASLGLVSRPMSDAATSRQHFAQGTYALRRHNPELARAHFEAAHTLASPLVSGHALRGLAQAALQEDNGDESLALLAVARRAYALCEDSERVLHDEPTPLVDDALEGRATCWVMEVDVHIQAGRFERAQAALDTAYPLYRGLDGRRSQADLWSATARLSQHYKRWTTAGVAWQRVIRIAESHKDRFLEAGAWLRLAEVRLRDADLPALEDCLEKAEPLVIDLDEADLTARMHSARAALFAANAEYEAAWDAGLDALYALEKVDDHALLDTTRLRMAGIALRVRPAESVPLMREVLASQQERKSKVMLALLAHRAAEAAFEQHKFAEALLAARAEEGLGPQSHAARLLQVRSLMSLGEEEAAAWLAAYQARTVGDDYPAAVAMAEALGDRLPDDEEVSFERVATEALPRRDKVVTRVAKLRGVPLEILSSARGIELILDQLATHQGALAVVGPHAAVPENPVMVWTDGQGEERTLQLPEGITTVGRGRANGIRISWDEAMARAHFALHRKGKKVLIRDLGTETGTKVSNIAIKGERQLGPGEVIIAGDTQFKLELRKTATAAAVTATAAVAVSIPG